MKIVKLMIAVLVILAIAGCGEKKEKKEAEVNAPAKITITEGAVQEQKAVNKKSGDNGEFYYSYNKAQQAQNQVEDEGKYTELGAYRHILNNYQKVQISLWANKLSKDFLIYCSACHDDYANGIIGPSLLDKDGSYIYEQLQKFKTGKRKNVLMEQLVHRLSDEKLKALSEEIAAFNKKVKKLLEQHGQKDRK
ncbi:MULTISPECIES: hypothetical protein [unclassified Nitratiruptor]|uniref:c-type cytochrome n=1 Tax=unclassified Nitratiruptor TaxID=2624044 RepID=UPI00191507B4|nr:MULTISPECIES: hypothetical protein [unclassified Nitratiruptor]BCD61063.1 hypothetical protein NitYY0810_C1844 [Nitratiruptor sp. YY08-10]BCD64996.1 hypothetical protein NitYY0814_C1853 [Nitratiruptor sp. YY08-14]